MYEVFQSLDDAIICVLSLSLSHLSLSLSSLSLSLSLSIYIYIYIYNDRENANQCTGKVYSPDPDDWDNKTYAFEGHVPKWDLLFSSLLLFLFYILFLSVHIIASSPPHG